MTGPGAGGGLCAATLHPRRAARKTLGCWSLLSPRSADAQKRLCGPPGFRGNMGTLARSCQPRDCCGQCSTVPVPLKSTKPGVSLAKVASSAAAGDDAGFASQLVPWLTASLSYVLNLRSVTTPDPSDSRYPWQLRPVPGFGTEGFGKAIVCYIAWLEVMSLVWQRGWDFLLSYLQVFIT